MLAIITPSLFGQESAVVSPNPESASKIIAGASMGYGRSLYDSNLGTDHGCAACPEFGKGQGPHERYSVWVDQRLLGEIWNYLYSTFSLGYAANNGWIDKRGDNLPIINPEGNIGYTHSNYRMKIDNDYLDATIGVGYRVLPVSIDASFIAGFRNSATTITSVTVLTPHNAVFDTTLFQPSFVEFTNNGRTMISSRKAADMHTTPLFGVQLAARYIIQAAPLEVHITPYYRYYFNSIHIEGTTTLSVIALDIRIGSRL